MQTRRVTGTRFSKQALDRLAAFEQRMAERRRAATKPGPRRVKR
jgi:hypothetical protein